MAAGMASFEPALPTDRDYVRFLVGDTDPDNAQLDDDTIDALLVRHSGRTFCAAADAGEAIAARWSAKTEGVIEKQVARLRIKRAEGSSLQAGYMDYLRTLRTRCADARLSTTPFFKVL
jgi:hypothetical protein